MTAFADSKILLIGAGKMGGALLAAWLHAGVSPRSITILETDVAQANSFTTYDVSVASSLEEISQAPDCIVLAVKPQSMDALLPSLKEKFRDKPLYLSIAAGKTLGYFAKHLGDAAVVRVMPNTPALIRRGISALVANTKVNEKQKQLATSLLDAAGETVWLENESLMDAVTAVSGSGPAYVFLFLDALAQAGKKHGLPEEVAKKLALYTVRGSAGLALKSEQSLEQLRKNVTSSGGTTEAALKVLMKEQGLAALLDEAVTAAVKRSKELG